MKGIWIGRAAKFVVLVALAITGFGWLVMSLWNALIPAIFQGPVITFWQAIGLLVLTRLLFAGFRPWSSYRQHRRHWQKRWEAKMASLTPEEREKIRLAYEKRCGRYWNWDNRDRNRTEQPQQTVVS